MDVFWLQKFQWKVLWSVQGSPVSWKFLHHRRKNDFQRCWISVGLCSWRLKKRKVPIKIEIISRFAKFEQIRYSYSRMLFHKALFRLDDGCTEIPVAVVFCSTRSDNESEGGDSGRLNQQSDEIWLWSIICYCKFAFSEKLFCSKFKRNLFANNSHEKKSSTFFRHPQRGSVIQQSWQSSPSARKKISGWSRMFNECFLWLSQLPRLRDDPTGSPGSPRRRELGCWAPGTWDVFLFGGKLYEDLGDGSCSCSSR